MLFDHCFFLCNFSLYINNVYKKISCKSPFSGCLGTGTCQFGGKVTVNYLHNLTFLKLFLLNLIFFCFFLQFRDVLETKRGH